MAISLRLDKKTEKAIEKYARSEGRTKSALIRELITEYIVEKESALSPWELGKDLFGVAASDHGTVADDHELILRERMRAKKNRA
jgi:predicted transcriptional regulator